MTVCVDASIIAIHVALKKLSRKIGVKHESLNLIPYHFGQEFKFKEEIFRIKPRI